MTLAAVMPLPEAMPELALAGVLAGSRIPMVPAPNGLPMPAQADFCLSGYLVRDKVLPEGPFGDHLGYYSLIHDFPVMRVDQVFHRPGAVWPFTTVGRPPQEDTEFGKFIHQLTGPVIPGEFPGVHEVHAVDAAGVHPLLLAVASERYVPFASDRRPQELLTAGLGLLGRSQTSLSKYVFVADKSDNPDLSAGDVPGFLHHILERADWTRDLHFITRTTMDTLDYSGISLNQGSKLLVAACGPARWSLCTEIPPGLSLPSAFPKVRLMAPGILVLSGPPHTLERDGSDPAMDDLAARLEYGLDPGGIRLAVVCDDADFTAFSWQNFLWVTFTRTDPATDSYGVGDFTHCKHWGCRGPLVLDARSKAFHAPCLEEDPEVTARVEAMAATGGPLHGLF
jgi:4-hydroxy-3-polyprenylbenzoate decarboxylase